MQQNKEEIIKALKLFFQPGDVFEIRCLGATIPGMRYPHTESGYFDYKHIDTIPKELENIHARGVYFTPNPVNPALLARAANRIKPAAKNESTSDGDILCRRWFLIDCDPSRPAKISASNTEHKFALAKTVEIRDKLTTEGFPDPVMLDSGNGAQLMYRIEESTDDNGLIQSCLKSLSSHSDDKVKIDLTVHNPARIWRLPGTWNCKGDEVDDRIYRQAKIISSPETIKAVSQEQLCDIASTENTQEIQKLDANMTSEFDLEAWILQYCPEVEGPEPWKDAQRWIFSVCPFNEAHDNRSAVLIQHASGAIAFKCHHDGCAGKDWHDLRELKEPVQTALPVQDVDLSLLLAKISGNYEPIIQDKAMFSKTASEIVDANDVESIDPNELLEHRFLCRCGGLLFVGPSGFGKSSFLIQAALIWAMGKPMMNINPKKSLKILIVQAENDDRDVAEQIVGAVKGFTDNNPDVDDGCIDEALKNIDIVRESSLTGGGFINSLNDKLESYLEDEQRDLVIIDPLFAYCGCDVSDQGQMSRFLRNWLNPKIEQHNVGLLMCHHTNKPPKEIVAPSALNLAYAGSGTAELTNWARAVLVISQDNNDESLFVLTAAKRGRRLRWKDGAIQKYMRHATDGTIYWNEVSPPLDQESKRSDKADLLARAVFLAHDELSPEPVADYLSRIQFELEVGVQKARTLMRTGLDKGLLGTVMTVDENSGKKHYKHIYRVSKPQGNLVLAGVF